MKKIPVAVLTVAMALSLGGCAKMYKFVFGWPSQHWRSETGAADFKPYVGDEMNSHPESLGRDPWVYPEGTKADDALLALKKGGILTRVYTRDFWGRDTGKLTVEVNPNFYHLSPEDQLSFARTIAGLYKVTDTKTFALTDAYTHRQIGTYSAEKGLQLY